MTTPSRDTLDRVKIILRRDLRLGDEVVVDDETALIGGEFDFDSLDVLMLVTSVEKEFDISIPNEVVGHDAFRTVDTLARFVDERAAASLDPEGRTRTQQTP